ncbi:hypothetical protein CRUP_017831, partial [Coryphaenoides rupestris]
YRYGYHDDQCPGPDWSVLCRNCCEYEVIRCRCPLQGARVGYAVPCCRNAINDPRDDFFIRGKFCTECRPGWSGGDCLKCGGTVRKRQGHLVLESYPNNARCEWTLQVDRPFTIDFRFMMLSLEFDHSCRYDYVEIRDGGSIRSRVIGRYCGNNRPAPIQSSGNELHVLFVSDGYKNLTDSSPPLQRPRLGLWHDSEDIGSWTTSYANTGLWPVWLHRDGESDENG